MSTEEDSIMLIVIFIIILSLKEVDKECFDHFAVLPYLWYYKLFKMIFIRARKCKCLCWSRSLLQSSRMIKFCVTFVGYV